MSDSSKLRKAAIIGDISVVTQCLEEGCHIDAEDCNGWTALMLASFNNQLGMITFLAQRGADMDRKNKFGRTALHYAIKKNHLSCVEILLSNNSNPNIPFIEEYSMITSVPIVIVPQLEIQYPLIEAVKSRNQQLIDILLQSPRIDLDVADELGNTALMYATYFGDNKMVQRLCHLGADVNHLSKTGGSALLTAMFAQKFKTAAILLDLGADTNVCTIDGETPYGYAEKYNQILLKQRILSKSAN